MKKCAFYTDMDQAVGSLTILVKTPLNGTITVQGSVDPPTTVRDVLSQLSMSNVKIDSHEVFHADSMLTLDSVIEFQVEPVTLSLRPRTFTITVNDLETRQMLRVTHEDTIAKVKAAFENETGRYVDNFSVNGRRLQDGDMLSAVGLQEGSVLVGTIKVFVVDSKCSLNTPVAINDYCTFADLKARYSQQARRELAFGAVICSAGGHTFDDLQTLYEASVVDCSSVTVENASYRVSIREKKEDAADPLEDDLVLEVYDHMTVDEVKTLYGRKTQQALLDDDKLMFEGRVLEDDAMLFRFGIVGTSELTLQRTDSSRSMLYECGSCGNDVRLKKAEPVRCRSCGHRIVYKKRTTRPCQYIAR